MTRIALLTATALLAALVAHVPSAAAIDCRVAPNPLPPSPVGGRVGEIYTFESNQAWGAFTFAVLLTCIVAGYGIFVVNQHCVFYLGAECLSIA